MSEDKIEDPIGIVRPVNQDNERREKELMKIIFYYFVTYLSIEWLDTDRDTASTSLFGQSDNQMQAKLGNSHP